MKKEEIGCTKETIQEISRWKSFKSRVLGMERFLGTKVFLMVVLPFETQLWWMMRSRLHIESLCSIRSGVVVLR